MASLVGWTGRAAFPADEAVADLSGLVEDVPADAGR
jgi:hypothetical protein